MEQHRRKTDDQTEFRADERITIREIIKDWEWTKERNNRIGQIAKVLTAVLSIAGAAITIYQKLFAG